MLPEKYKIQPVFHVSLLKPTVPDPFSHRNPGPLAPIMFDYEEEYEIEAIMYCRRRGSRIRYLIKWKGNSPEESSWKPEDNVHAPRLVRKFFQTHPAKMSQMVGGG